MFTRDVEISGRGGFQGLDISEQSAEEVHA